MNYNPSLDGIRALSVIAVMAFHARVPGFTGGFLGVDVFFVLSGFLITRLLQDEHDRTGGIALLPFYTRRLRRLYPALLVFLSVYLLLAPHAFPLTPHRKHAMDAFLTVTYLSDIAQGSGYKFKYLVHTWSLAAEQQFYLIWPPILLLVLRLPGHRAVRVLALLFVAATAWRWSNTALLGEDHWRVYYRFDTHATGLLLGCLLAVARVELDKRWAWAGFAGLAVAMAAFVQKDIATSVIGLSLAELSAGLIVAARPGWLGVAPLACIGQLSYGLYLWHYPAMRWGRLHEWHWLATFAFGAALALAAAWLSYHLVEKRLRKPSAVGAPVTGNRAATVPRPAG